MGMMNFAQRVLIGGVIAVFWTAGVGDLAGQTPARRPAAPAAKAAPAPVEAVEPITALLISDVHFDPFRDPSKAEKLIDAPEGEWNKIFEEHDALDQKEAFGRVQTACKETAEDSPYPLVQSALAAMMHEAPEAKFATLSGDLVVHSLECRFKALAPGKSEADYKAFAEKTERYVINQIRVSLGGMPVYVAMGNNDNTCKDYAIDVDDSFLSAMKEPVVGWLPEGAEKTAAVASFSHTGDYSMMMLAPMQKTRLIVLDDLFQSRRYTSCSGTPNDAAVAAQLAWLDKELAGAKRRGERVWVLGHIPPGLDSFTTLMQHKNVCAGEAPVMFLSNEGLADVMGKYADVIRLGVFGHSHMDEIRLFGGAGEAGEAEGAKGKVAIKMVSGMTPLAAGVAEFTVAKVDPASARMVDYTVFSTSNASGVNTSWAKMYSFGGTYQKTEFSPEALNELIESFEGDPEALGSASGAYLRSVVGGQKGLMLKALWPQYTCMLEHHTAKGYAACVCPAK